MSKSNNCVYIHLEYEFVYFDKHVFNHAHGCLMDQKSFTYKTKISEFVETFKDEKENFKILRVRKKVLKINHFKQ